MKEANSEALAQYISDVSDPSSAALKCTFYEYTKASSETLIRTPSFYLPGYVAASLSLVTGATEFPIDIWHGPGVIRSLDVTNNHAALTKESVAAAETATTTEEIKEENSITK